ncbi:MAG: response regulator, partial [Rubripirellula sp.]
SLTMAKVVADEVVEAKNGKEALQQLETQSFDVMLCDLNMPELTGDALLEQLMQQTTIAIPPVIIVSSEASNERVERLNCDRIVGTLRKPFSPEDIADLFAKSEQLLNAEVI